MATSYTSPVIYSYYEIYNILSYYCKIFSKASSYLYLFLNYDLVEMIFNEYQNRNTKSFKKN